MPSYRIGQVAELLGVSVDTVRRWADAGRLAVVYFPAGEGEGEQPRIPRESFDRFLEAQKRKENPRGHGRKAAA